MECALVGLIGMRKFVLPFVLAFGIAGPVYAQTAPTTTVNSMTMKRVNADGSAAPARASGILLTVITLDDCTADRAYKITLFTPNPGNQAYTLQAWAGTSDCTPNAARRLTANQTCWNVTQPLDRATTSVTVRVRDLVANDKSKGESYVNATDASVCNAIGKGSIQLQFMWVAAGDQAGSPATGNPTFTIDTTGPGAPTGLSVEAGESLLVTRWDKPAAFNEITSYRVYCDPNPTDGSTTVADDAGSTTDASRDLDATTTDASDIDASDIDASDVDAGTGDDAGSASDAATQEPAEDAGTTVIPGSGCGSALFAAGKTPAATLVPCAESQGAIATQLNVTGLENGKRYAVAVAAVNRSGNVSPLSNVTCGTPVLVDTFFDQYKAAGGGADGCATASASPSLAALGLATIAMLARMRRRSR